MIEYLLDFFNFFLTPKKDQIYSAPPNIGGSFIRTTVMIKDRMYCTVVFTTLLIVLQYVKGEYLIDFRVRFEI